MSKYALVPDGFTLKKVSKAEEEAIKDHRRHEDFKTFLDNETTPILIGGTMAVAFTPLLWALFFKALKEADVTVSDTQKGVVLGRLPAVIGADNILGGILGVGGVKLTETPVFKDWWNLITRDDEK